MIFPIVEFCISNLANGAQEARQRLEKDPNLDIIEYGCLSYCGKCARTLYALVDGDPVEADTPEELVEKIYQHIEENPMY